MSIPTLREPALWKKGEGLLLGNWFNGGHYPSLIAGGFGFNCWNSHLTWLFSSSFRRLGFFWNFLVFTWFSPSSPTFRTPPWYSKKSPCAHKTIVPYSYLYPPIRSVILILTTSTNIRTESRRGLTRIVFTYFHETGTSAILYLRFWAM